MFVGKFIQLLTGQEHESHSTKNGPADLKNQIDIKLNKLTKFPHKNFFIRTCHLSRGLGESLTLHVFKIKIPCRCRNEFKGEGGGAGSVQAH